MLYNLDIRLLLRLAVIGWIVNLSEACFGGSALGYYPPPQQYGPAYGAPYGPYSAASRTRMASPSHTLTSSNSLDELQPIADCIQRFPNQKLGCIQPFERRVPSSEHECQQICDEYTSKCRGYQFDTLMNQCELFDVDRNGKPKSYDDINYKDDALDGSYKRRHKRHPNKNPFDEFLRDPLRMMSGEPQLPALYCEPALIPTIGTNYIQSDYNCRMSASIQPPPESPSYQPQPKASTITKMSVGRSAQTPVPLQGPDCQDGANARIQLIDGIELVEAKPVITVQLDSPDACLHICRLNTHLDGTHFPRACKSSSFDRSSGKCHIFDSTISPNGDLNYMPNPNSIYFEKFCIPLNELPMGCDDVIHRIPQHTLDRRAAGTGAIVTASTQINCIRQCISAVRQLGFECMSASYFFDWPSENCYLSRFTRISRPDIYIAERKQFVDYMEMAKCMHNNNWQHDQAPSSWSEWSKCDESLTKSRQRNCTGCKQRKESIPCEAAYQHDFPKALSETESEPKNIATNFESARRYKEASKTNVDLSSESSLFGEHDYENQREVSFFGPPLAVEKEEKKSNDNLDKDKNSSNSLFTLRSNIRPIQTGPPAHTPPANFNSEKSLEKPLKSQSNDDLLPLAPPFDAPEPGDFASAEIFAKSQFNLANDLNNVGGERHKQLSAKKFEPTSENEDEHLLLKKALQETDPVESKSEEAAANSGKLLVVKKVETTTENVMIGDCDPKTKCCPRPNNQKSARLRGCVIGYKLGSNGNQIACITEEYCAQQAESFSGMHKINNLLVFIWLIALFV